MRRIALCLLALCCLLLTGCASLLDRSYSTVEEHSSKYWESEAAGTLRAETYQDIVNDLLLLVGRHTESAVLRLYNYDDGAIVADLLEQAATEVQQETPMGAYAVEYITSENQSQRGYYEVRLNISYRRTAEQIQNIVNATSTVALPDLLNAAILSGKTELAVRISYWSSNGAANVAQAVADVREAYGLTDSAPWVVNYYPAEGDVGLVEFLMEPDPEDIAQAAPDSSLEEVPADTAADAAENSLVGG
jgi:uncharacterized protein YceK